MQEAGLFREQLASPDTFSRLQHEILVQQHAKEAALQGGQLAGQSLISDRSGIIDNLAYTTWRFGLNSLQASCNSSKPHLRHVPQLSPVGCPGLR